MLLIAAGLLLASFARLQRVEPGFEPEGIFTAQLALPPQRYDGDKLVAFYEQLPSARDAAEQHVGRAHRSRAADRRTDAGAGRGRRPPRAADERTAARESSSRVAAYFTTLGIPVRAGRDFDERDSARVPHVVIVNETFAARHFPAKIRSAAP